MAVFKAPDSVAKNAQQALDWREKYPKETADSGQIEGWTRARQLANQENISEDIINRMVSFFARQNEKAYKKQLIIKTINLLMQTI